MSHLILRGDARRIPLANGSVYLIITSPPYWAQRSYRDAGGHYDGQIGSEPHPRHWLEAMFEVMKECWRVLAPGGSVFINLGDKRSGSGGAGGDYNPGGLRDGQPRAKRAAARPSRWSREDAAWLAGVIDCDGSISVKVNSVQRPSPYFVGWMRVGQMRPEVVKRCAVVTGVGQVFQDARGVWNWNVAAQQARYVLERIWPWLRIKQAQALAVIELQRHVEELDGGNGRAVPRSLGTIRYRQMIRDAVVGWNKGLSCDWRPPYSRPVELPERPELGRRKSRQLLPERFAIGCEDGLADPEGIGWIVRQIIVWQKANGLPESVTDRTRDDFEYIYHLTKFERYFAAIDEIREPHAPSSLASDGRTYQRSKPGHQDLNDDGWRTEGMQGATTHIALNPLGKVPGSVWRIASEPLRTPDRAKERYNLPDHFAAFPTEIPRRLILGFSPSGICTACNEPRCPVVEKRAVKLRGESIIGGQKGTDASNHWGGMPVLGNETTITGYACRCPDTSAPTRNGVVLDVFGGSGTTALIAETLGRTGISLDLSADYCNLARWRIEESGHGAKAEQRTWGEAQGQMF